MTGYQVTTTTAHGTPVLAVKTTDTQELVCHCTIHSLGETDIVYPVAVMTLAPKHRQTLPDLKLQLLVHLLQQHRAILLSAGNDTAGGRFSWQTQLEYAMSHGYNTYQLAGSQIERFDDKNLQTALAKPWGQPLPLVLVSRHELPFSVAHEIPVDYVNSLNQIDARAVAGFS